MHPICTNQSHIYKEKFDPLQIRSQSGVSDLGGEPVYQKKEPVYQETVTYVLRDNP